MPLNFAGGSQSLYLPPPVEIAVTPRLLGRGRLPLEFIRGHLGVRQQPMWGEAGLLWDLALPGAAARPVPCADFQGAG